MTKAFLKETLARMAEIQDFFLKVLALLDFRPADGVALGGAVMDRVDAQKKDGRKRGKDAIKARVFLEV